MFVIFQCCKGFYLKAILVLSPNQKYNLANIWKTDMEQAIFLLNRITVREQQLSMFRPFSTELQLTLKYVLHMLYVYFLLFSTNIAVVCELNNTVELCYSHAACRFPKK